MIEDSTKKSGYFFQACIIKSAQYIAALIAGRTMADKGSEVVNVNTPV
jgi:hypothetical protein